jgi:hypothetical protein
LRVPIIIGTRYSATDCTTGTANRNIIVDPCTVNSWLYLSGPMSEFSGRASCTRISAASTPARAKNANAVMIERSAIDL